MPNAYLKKQKEIQEAIFDVGMRTGEQFALDIMQIALHRQGWGYKRIQRTNELIAQLANEYINALRKGVEQDVYQEHMDAELRDIIKDKQKLIPFLKRYPEIKEIKY